MARILAPAPWLTVAEVAAFLGVGVRTLYRAIDRGEFPVVRLGRRILITKAMLPKPGPAPLTKECPQCREIIPAAATRCKACAQPVP